MVKHTPGPWVLKEDKSKAYHKIWSTDSGAIKEVFSAIGAAAMMAVIIALISLWIGVGSGLIDPERMLSNKRYPDNIITSK